jgi:hypothetical protein
MAFTSISNTLIAVGKAITAQLWSTTKENFDDLNTRLNAVETTARKVSVFEFPVLNGSRFASATGLAYFFSSQSFTVTNASFQIFEINGIGGTLEIDVKRSTTDLDDSSFASIFTTRPSVNYTFSSDYDESTNQVLDATKINISPGDILRLDITGVPAFAVCPKFIIKVYGEV